MRLSAWVGVITGHNVDCCSRTILGFSVMEDARKNPWQMAVVSASPLLSLDSILHSYVFTYSQIFIIKGKHYEVRTMA